MAVIYSILPTTTARTAYQAESVTVKMVTATYGETLEEL
jgi:hypothetical protein